MEFVRKTQFFILWWYRMQEEQDCVLEAIFTFRIFGALLSVMNLKRKGFLQIIFSNEPTLDDIGNY